MRLAYGKEVANLKAELQVEVEKRVALSREVQGLKEQVAIDQATIEGLRLLKSPVTDVVQLKDDHAKEHLDRHAIMSNSACEDAEQKIGAGTTPKRATHGSGNSKEEALLNAIRAGESQGLMWLLREETRLPIASPMLVGKIHHAISCGHVDTAKLFLETAPCKMINARGRGWETHGCIMPHALAPWMS